MVTCGSPALRTPALHPVPAPVTAAYAIRKSSKPRDPSGTAKRIKLVIGSTGLHIWVLLDAVPPKSGRDGVNKTRPFLVKDERASSPL
jgi:hypothetical protein